MMAPQLFPLAWPHVWSHAELAGRCRLRSATSPARRPLCLGAIFHSSSRSQSVARLCGTSRRSGKHAALKHLVGDRRCHLADESSAHLRVVSQYLYGLLLSLRLRPALLLGPLLPKLLTA